MTKVFTGISLALSVNANKVDLEDTIQKFIPSEMMPTDEGKNMTFVDLATHWSGLPTRPDNFPDPGLLRCIIVLFCIFVSKLVS